MSRVLEETIYTPESPIRRPGLMFKQMWRDLKVSRELAWRLTVRDISAQYRQSVFGVLWAFLPPLALTAVFIFLNRSTALPVDNQGVPYPAFVLVGMVFWQLFTESLGAPLKMVVSTKTILVKINFPREALMLSAIMQTLFSFGIKFLLVIAVFVWYQLPVPWTVCLVPFAILAVLMFGFVLGIFLVPFGVLYNDIGQALSLLTTFWLFITPVAYTPKQTGTLALFTKYNPVTPLITTARDWMISGGFQHIGGFLLLTLFSIIAVILGWIIYRVSLPIILERVSA